MVITLPSHKVWEAPDITYGFFWTGILTVFVAFVLQGALAIAVIVISIYSLSISVELGVTNGVNEVEFEISVPVVEVQL